MKLYSSDLLHLIREYFGLASTIHGASILAKACLYLDRCRKSHHTLERQPFAPSLLVTFPLPPKKSLCLSYLPKPSPLHHSHLLFQILQLSLQLLPPFPILPAACQASHQPLPLLAVLSWPLRLVFMLVESHMTLGHSRDWYRHWSDTSKVLLSSPWKVAQLRL